MTAHDTSTLDRVPSPSTMTALRGWGRRQWGSAVAGAIATAVVIGVPTDVIPNPLFGRPVDVTWWSPLVLVVTAVLGGLVLATYVAAAPASGDDADNAVTLADRPARLASVGGVLGFLAVGCPVCNKLVVVALGTTGALSWFAPIQPVLAIGSVVVLGFALRARLRGQVACRIG